MVDSITDEEHAIAIKWVRKHIGLELNLDKKYLIETRLEPIAYKYKFNSIGELIQLLENGEIEDPILLEEVCSSITTHETSFFRDFHPFEYLRETYFPEFLRDKSNKNQLSVWSCACSSGQEIYSLLMLLDSFFPELLEDPTFLATDISKLTLQKAEFGEFSQSEISRGLMAKYLVKYFQQVPNGNWVFAKHLRNKVNFEYHNLIESWDNIGSFHVIFLRNVLIYFDVELKKKILNRLKEHLMPGGILFLGSSETTINLDEDWQVCRGNGTVFYQLK